jgi:Undecaprenyl-phosphate glucose phosphotransferase
MLRHVVSEMDASPGYRSGFLYGLRYGQIGTLTLGLDLVLVVALSVVSGAGYHLASFGRVGSISDFVAAGCATAVLFTAIMQANGLYRPRDLLAGGRGKTSTLLAIWACVFAFLAIIAFSLKISSEFSRGAMLLFFALGAVVLVLARRIGGVILRNAVANGTLGGRRAVVLADEGDIGGASTLAELKQHGYRIRRCFPIDFSTATAPFDETVHPVIAELIAYVREHDVDEVLITGSWMKLAHIQAAAAKLHILPMPVQLIADSDVRKLMQSPVRELGPTHAVELKRAALSFSEQAVKRVFDILVASAGLIALAPLLLIVAVLVRLDSRGPVFFRQNRIGFNGRAFRIWKFRTMTSLDDGAVVQQASRSDQRVTRVGRWLRRTSIDELPQLLNVLGGDMSLVGPRPHARAHDGVFDKMIANYALRHHVKPGITGWAQVNGWRGATDTEEKLLSRVEFDLWYIKNWSVLLDLRILWMTVIEVAKGSNAYGLAFGVPALLCLDLGTPLV